MHGNLSPGTSPRSLRRRAVRPALTRATLYRLAVPALLLAFALLTAGLVLLAAGVLLGIVPYPGK